MLSWCRYSHEYSSGAEHWIPIFTGMTQDDDGMFGWTHIRVG